MDHTSNYTNNYMIPFQDAMALLTSACRSLDVEYIDTLSALGRVTAESITSPESVPSFNNTAMDGYAVNHCDLEKASSENPVILKLIGTTAAGDWNEYLKKTSGTACKVMTGAPVHDGYDAVIPVENTQLDGDKVYCYSSADKGAHIRRIGEDFSAHEKIIDLQTNVTPSVIAALSALGVSRIKVYKKAKVTVFSTGRELVDDMTQPLKKGQIRNSNKPYIINWLKHLPVEIIDAGTNFDDAEKFEIDLSRQIEKNVDIIISSGAVSMGDFDFIPATIIKMGGEIIFHKSKIRPGKPILFAKFPNGTLFIGLPGNPISAAIGLRFMVSHLILMLNNLPPEKPITGMALNDYNKKAGFRTIWKSVGSINDSGQFGIEILDGQESFKIKPMIESTGWAVVEESKESLNAGDRVWFYPNLLDWG